MVKLNQGLPLYGVTLRGFKLIKKVFYIQRRAFLRRCFFSFLNTSSLYSSAPRRRQPNKVALDGSRGERCVCGRAKCFHKSLVVEQDGFQKHSSGSRSVSVCVSSVVQTDSRGGPVGSSERTRPKLLSY